MIFFWQKKGRGLLTSRGQIKNKNCYYIYLFYLRYFPLTTRLCKSKRLMLRGCVLEVIGLA
jgi:hypothetical protein